MTALKPQVDSTALRLKELLEMALKIGAGVIDVVAISPNDIFVEDDLANFCREPQCTYYGVSANCPPHVDGPAGFRHLAKTCEYALVVKIPVPMVSLLSHEQRDIMKLLHEIVADIEKSTVELGYSNSKAFAVGSCKEIFCHDNFDCRVLSKGEGCRHYQYARPPIEAFGINVNELAKTAGWSMNRIPMKLILTRYQWERFTAWF